MGSFQPRKPDLNKRNWQSHSSYTTRASFQEQGQPEKCFTTEAGGKTGPLAAAPALGASWGMQGLAGVGAAQAPPGPAAGTVGQAGGH